MPPEKWLDRVEHHLGRLSDLLGPFPYPELWISVIPSQSSGIEFPSALPCGEDRFDRALRAYIAENAHRVAAPRDVAEAFADLPAVRDVLVENGALPPP